MAGIEAESSRCGIGKLPSLALDSGIHAGMTGFGAKLRIAEAKSPSWRMKLKQLG